MTDTWLVVADGNRACIFATDAEMASISLVRTLANPHRENAHHHPADGRETGHHAEEARFARDVAAAVVQGVNDHEVRDVVLVAPPRVLGDLDAALPKPAAAHVTARVGRDLVHFGKDEIAARVRAHLAGHHIEDAH